jgi:simple sugar transport system ATP-binding protein
VGQRSPLSESLDATATQKAPLAVEARNIVKSFGPNPVLKNVSMSIPVGGSRALVGRNGAGKSTLVGVLTGLLTADSGDVAFDSEAAYPTRTRPDGRRQVSCVYQKSTLAPTLSVAENLFINRQPGSRYAVHWPQLRRETRKVLDEWELPLDPDTETGTLRSEYRQIIEIARALLQGARFLILDEPTAALESKEIERLFTRIARLRADHVTILYISHHLQEIYDVCDSVTVMRDGRIVAEAPLPEMNAEEVVAAMLGPGAPGVIGRRRVAPVSARATPALEVRGLSLPPTFLDVDFSISEGECLGLAGLGGSGKEAIGEAIAGLARASGGEIRVRGLPLAEADVAKAQRLGVSYVPRDRLGRGVLPHLSIAENLTITIMRRLERFGLISPKRRTDSASAFVESLGIVCASIEQPVGELSGGNQQKTVMGRALASRPSVLVLVYPTQGVDVAAKEALFAIIERARSEGTAVLLISDDVEELRVCHRILVIFQGRIVRAFGDDWTERELIASIEGVVS